MLMFILFSILFAMKWLGDNEDLRVCEENKKK